MAVSSHGSPVDLFDSRCRQLVRLPPAHRGPVVLAFDHPGGEPPQLSQHRGAIVADTLRRFLAWKGYEVRTAHRNEVGDDELPTRPGIGYPIDVRGSADGLRAGSGPEVLCRVLVAPVELRKHFCRFVGWHREGREATLPDLLCNGLTAAQFRLAMVMAGRYRRPRRLWCRAAHHRGFLEDAQITHRRLRRLVRDHGPLPDVPTYLAGTDAMAHGNGRRALDDIDRCLSADLHTPRAVAVWHRGLRRDGLSHSERKVLLAAAQVLLGVPAHVAGDAGCP